MQLSIVVSDGRRRAYFQLIATTVLCVQCPGAHVTDPAELPYRNLRKGIRLRLEVPVHR